MDISGSLHEPSSFIKCSDFRVSPTEVEDIVYSSGQVTDVVAFGTPDEMLGHVVNIVVSPSHTILSIGWRLRNTVALACPTTWYRDISTSGKGGNAAYG